jgi:hypothetical protein
VIWLPLSQINTKSTILLSTGFENLINCQRVLNFVKTGSVINKISGLKRRMKASKNNLSLSMDVILDSIADGVFMPGLLLVNK